jgi:hypothetical protein
MNRIANAIGRSAAWVCLAGVLALGASEPSQATTYSFDFTGGPTTIPLTIATAGTLFFDLNIDPIDAFGNFSLDVQNNSGVIINSMNFAGAASGGVNPAYGDQTGQTVFDGLPNSATWSVNLNSSDLQNISLMIFSTLDSPGDPNFGQQPIPPNSPFLDVQFTPTPVGVPGPIAGAGFPGLVFAGGGLFAWWRNRRPRSEGPGLCGA